MHYSILRRIRHEALFKDARSYDASNSCLKVFSYHL